MYQVSLQVSFAQKLNAEIIESLELYLDFLHSSRQIIYRDWQFEMNSEGLSVLLSCPEMDAFKNENAMIHTRRVRERLEKEHHCELSFTILGIDVRVAQFVIPLEPSFLILKSASFSPVLDGKTLVPIPLYKLPSTYHDGEGFYDLNSWERNYEHVLGLWFNGKISEKWAQNQLQRHDSALSKQGLACTRRIEELTGIPTYYFLFNHRAIPKERDRKRTCPSCGGNWFLGEFRLSPEHSFQCDSCRLISEDTKCS